jgi:quercetin dioxygenase-like cupin family protein
MRPAIFFTAFITASVFSASAMADETGPVKPTLVLQKLVEGLPTGGSSEIRVFTAAFKPGDKTPYHTHGFPVTVYVLEGKFTLEMKDQAPIVVSAGEAFVEPPNTAMTGFNKSQTEMTKVVVFYVSTPGQPFLDPIK